MNAPVTKLEPESELSRDPLALLRAPFAPNQVSKLPKPTKQQTDEVKANFRAGIRCPECRSWHHPDVVHLDYVGHAAVTDRLLDADPMWSWEPCAFGPNGLPAFDQSGGLWIKLTVAGVTRLGYGHAPAKPGQGPGDREKEVIGDALRNAGMRFGMALDLWHKGDLHLAEAEPPPPSAEDAAINVLRAAAADRMLFKDAWETNKEGWKAILSFEAYSRVVAVMKEVAAAFPAEPQAEASAHTPAPPAPPPGAISRAAMQPLKVEQPLLDDEIPF